MSTLTAPEPVAAVRSGNRPFWLLLWALYTTQFIGASFLSTGLVGILRDGGTDLGTLGMLQLLALVAGQQHRCALGQQQRGQQVAHLPLAQGVDLRIVGLAFDAVVARAFVVGAVLVVLAVGLVVLVLVADQIAQGEAVVGSDEIDRRDRSSSGVDNIDVGLGVDRDVISIATNLNILALVAEGVPLPVPEQIAVLAPPIGRGHRQMLCPNVA